MPTNSPVTFEHHKGRLWIEKNKTAQKHKLKWNWRRETPSPATARVEHAPPPGTILYRSRALEPPNNHHPRLGRQAVTLTRGSKEWPPWLVLATRRVGKADTVVAGGHCGEACVLKDLAEVCRSDSNETKPKEHGQRLLRRHTRQPLPNMFVPWSLLSANNNNHWI
jgi:hypothetical protein